MIDLGMILEYAIKNKKISEQLGWYPKYSFKNALKTTLEWYLGNLDWCKEVMNNSDIMEKELEK